MPIQIRKGLTFRMKNPENDIPHLYVVLTNPNSENRVFCVNVTDIDNIVDHSCIIEPSEWNCISKRSAAKYSGYGAIEPIIMDLETQFENQDNFFGNASTEIVDKIIEGAKKTTALAKKFKKYLI